MKDKFRSFLEQYELREKHFKSVVRSKDLELQLYEAKLQQQKQLTEQEMIKVRIFIYLRSLFYVIFTNNFFLFY